MIQKDEGKQNKVGGHKGRLNFCIRNKLKNNFKNLQKKPVRPEKNFSAIIFVMAILYQVTNVAPWPLVVLYIYLYLYKCSILWGKNILGKDQNYIFLKLDKNDLVQLDKLIEISWKYFQYLVYDTCMKEFQSLPLTFCTCLKQRFWPIIKLLTNKLKQGILL